MSEADYGDVLELPASEEKHVHSFSYKVFYSSCWYRVDITIIEDKGHKIDLGGLEHLKPTKNWFKIIADIGEELDRLTQIY